MVGVCILLHKKSTKQGFILLHGPPNVGKSYIFSMGLSCFAPINIGGQISGNFSFNSYGSPALVSILDDCKMTFDNDEDLEKFKNIVAQQSVDINMKYAPITKSYQMPTIMLSNMSNFTYLNVMNASVQDRAIWKRCLVKIALTEQVPHMKIATVYDIWHYLLYITRNAPICVDWNDGYGDFVLNNVQNAML